jgi:hypothetical protein
MRKFLLLLLLAPVSLYAQVKITGKVVSSENKSPLPDVSVFLSNSKVGNKTQKDGSFTLSDIKAGRYELVVSCVGYKPYSKNIIIGYTDTHLPTIGLEDRVGELGEVKITSERDKTRERYIALFTRAFLGSTKNAADCKIVNPEVIDFTYDKKSTKLSASTSIFLIIDNKALGYRIKYLIQSFLTDPILGFISYTGSSVFEPMTSNALQEKIWQNNRAEAYRGSTMHFLRSCIANVVNENSFTVRELVRPEYRPTDSLIMRRISHFRNSLSVSERNDSLTYWITMYYTPKFAVSSLDKVLQLGEYIKLTNEKGIYAFGHHSKALLINYMNKINSIDKHSSFVTFIEPNTFFDNNGVIFTPGNTLFEGYWATTRVAEQLPVDYELPQEIEIQQAATPNTNDNFTH